MKPKWIFVLKVLVISVVLLFVWPLFSEIYIGVLSNTATVLRKSVGLMSVEVMQDKVTRILIPAIALFFSAAGASNKKKFAFSAGAVAALFLIDLFFMASGLQATAEGGGALGSGTLTEASNILYHAYGWVIPLAGILLFVGENPNAMWKRPPKTNAPRKRSNKKKSSRR